MAFDWVDRSKNTPSSSPQLPQSIKMLKRWAIKLRQLKGQTPHAIKKEKNSFGNEICTCGKGGYCNQMI